MIINIPRTKAGWYAPIIALCLFCLLFRGIASAQDFSAARATRESDKFGGEKEKQVEKELKRIPARPAAPEVEEEKPKPGEQRFFVKKITLIGCESFPPEDFLSFVEKFEDKDITLTELGNLSREISSEYLKRGIIAAVFLPPQEVKDHVVTMQVVEARMGELEVQKAPFFGKKSIRYYWGIKPGEILRYDEMSKSIQMMNKNPDLEVRAALHAGDKPGTTNVTLTPRTRFPIHGQYTFDREGITTTGKERNGFGVRDNNLFGYNDTLISGISYGKNFDGIYAYHSIPVSPDGASLLYGYSYSLSTPQKDYDRYALKSTAETVTLSLRQDIYKGDNYLGDVYATFDSKDKVTWYKLGQGTLNRDRLRILTFGGSCMIRGTGSVTYLSSELNQGVNIFGTSKKNNPLSSRLGASPTYTKYTLGIQNRTSLPFNLQQSLKFKMQIPSEKLFSQEQYGLGGIDTVRGYPPSDYLADKMALVNAELLTPLFFIPKSWKLPYAEQPIVNQITAVGFFDYGYGEHRGDPKPHTLASFGAGLRMSFYNQVLLRLEWGFPLKPPGQDFLSEGMSIGRFHISLNIEDKLPSEIERIIKEMREERMRNEAWVLVDEELAAKDSSIRKKLHDYLRLADDLYMQGRLKESKEMYEVVAAMSKSLYKQAEKYVKECGLHEKELEKKSEEALLAYRDGKLDESRMMWEDIVKESVPRPLFFEF
jgi:hemolysin activation/secretion protein